VLSKYIIHILKTNNIVKFHTLLRITIILAEIHLEITCPIKKRTVVKHAAFVSRRAV